jgi:hypothetical protein
LMGYRQLIDRHIDSVARGIDVANAQPNKRAWPPSILST